MAALGRTSSLTESSIREKVEAALADSEFERLKAADHGQRVVPSGAKSSATVDRIIMAAAELLDSSPLRDITTRSVADHADENIATVYRYFEDLEAILVELAFRWQTASLLGIKEMAVTGALATDRKAWIDEMIDISASFRKNTPGDLGLSRDAAAIPPVMTVIRAAEKVASEMLAVALDIHDPGKGMDFWYPRVLTIIRSAGRCLTDACSQDPVDQVQIDLLKDLTLAFFEPVLD